MAAVLKLLSKCRQQEDPSHANKLMESALVIQDLDPLFDLTNGPSSYKDVKKGIQENVSQKTDH